VFTVSLGPRPRRRFQFQRRSMTSRFRCCTCTVVSPYGRNRLIANHCSPASRGSRLVPPLLMSLRYENDKSKPWWILFWWSTTLIGLHAIRERKKQQMHF